MVPYTCKVKALVTLRNSFAQPKRNGVTCYVVRPSPVENSRFSMNRAEKYRGKLSKPAFLTDGPNAGLQTQSNRIGWSAN